MVLSPSRIVPFPIFTFLHTMELIILELLSITVSSQIIEFSISAPSSIMVFSPINELKIVVSPILEPLPITIVPSSFRRLSKTAFWLIHMSVPILPILSPSIFKSTLPFKMSE
ncbi:MAG: hypothetical protein DDT22_00532 [candidate division WS2 bacterium]|nr:hypothetical protein [Candidatus Lithacetigena glycinireducens]